MSLSVRCLQQGRCLLRRSLLAPLPVMQQRLYGQYTSITGPERHGLTMPQMHNLTRFFDVMLDQTKDGVCTWKDFQRIVDHTKKINKWSDDDPAFKKCTESKRRHWDELCSVMDKDKDSTIRLTDFLSAWGTVLHGKAAMEDIPEWASHFFSNMFDFMDRDGDGAITADDYRDFACESRQDASDVCRNSFSLLDTDGDGKLTKPQWAVLCTDYLFSEDHTKPGHYLFQA